MTNAEDRAACRLTSKCYWKGLRAKYEVRTGDTTSGCFIDSIGEVAVGEIIRFKWRLLKEAWIDVKVCCLQYPNAGVFKVVPLRLIESVLNGLSRPKHIEGKKRNECVE